MSTHRKSNSGCDDDEQNDYLTALGWPVTAPERARLLADHQHVTRLARQAEIHIIGPDCRIERVEPRAHLDQIVSHVEHVDRVTQLFAPCHLDHPKACSCRCDGRAWRPAASTGRPPAPSEGLLSEGNPSRWVVERGRSLLPPRSRPHAMKGWPWSSGRQQGEKVIHRRPGFPIEDGFGNMGLRHYNDPTPWRARAEELRVLAETMKGDIS